MNEEHNGWRDLTPLLEHRRHLPNDRKSVDIDTLGYRTRNGNRWSPSYVIEWTWCNDHPEPVFHPAPMTSLIGRMLKIPALVAHYQTERPLDFCPTCRQPVQGSAGAITHVHIRSAHHRDHRLTTFPAAELWRYLETL